MLELVLEVTNSVLRHALYLVNRLLNTVRSSCLEIADTVCLMISLSLSCVWIAFISVIFQTSPQIIVTWIELDWAVK